MNTDRIMKIGKAKSGYENAHNVFSVDGIAPTMTSAMGMGGGICTIYTFRNDNAISISEREK